MVLASMTTAIRPIQVSFACRSRTRRTDQRAAGKYNPAYRTKDAAVKYTNSR
jgi:hypothetical protein